MDAWRKSDVSGELEIIDALVRRRAAEKALFLKEQTGETSPSAFMRAKLDHAASILGAPVSYASAPAVGSIPVTPQKPEAGERLAEILKSEPATEALLLTQVVAHEEPAEGEAAAEIVTAHAKPVARKIDRSLVKTPAPEKKEFFPALHPAQVIGLVALLAFGAGLITLGAFTFLNGRSDFVTIMSGSALAAPGVAALLLGGFGLWRSQTTLSW